MADLDRLLRSDISYAAADAVRPPDFTPIERRGVRRRRSRALLSAAAAGLVLVVAATAGPRVLDRRDSDRVTPLQQPPPRSLPISGEGLLEPGTYLVPRDESALVDYTISFPAGWQIAGANEFYRDEDPARGGVGIGILPFVVDEIYSDACRGDRGSVTPVGPRPGDLVTALLAQRGPVKSAPVDATFGGYPATRIDLRVPDSLKTRNCFLGPGTGVQVWNSPHGRYLVIGSDNLVSVYVIDVNGRAQVFTVQYRPEQLSTADRAQLEGVLDSIRIRH